MSPAIKNNTFDTLDFIPDADRSVLIAAGQALEFREGGCLFLKGDVGKSLYIIESGEICISINSMDGREIILNRLIEGDIFGEITMLDGGMRTANAHASPGTKVISVGHERFMDFLDQRPALYRGLIGLLCKRLRFFANHVESFALADGLERLAGKLFQMLPPQQKSGHASIDISQSELAKMVGLTREVVNRNLRMLQTEGAVRLERKRIVIVDMEKLKAFQRRVL